ncbi:DUF4384 domain-containing protein [Anaeromyxobacter oryzae]|uniref:DUF4384 domain-containing protein n=1 Tax=Anaeromyxobacter oryzae TaxID=2918170 RepID=A0ABN6MW27_9BACT|nr:DUF4384 domain-containing protein [Anaeromyxobacter oryzae]BDG05121.1 hypothetical protein AMOR_41170 [Anaeromyxobacter oryzae]
MTRCPTELELETYLVAPSRSNLEPHLAACSRCRDEVGAMRQLGEDFRRDVFPRTVDAVVAGSRGTRLPRWGLVAASLSAAAAAAILLVTVRSRSEYVGVKGGDLGLTVFVKDAAGTRAARDGEPVQANAAVRFRVRPARACRLVVLSVDGAGQVSRLFPASGDAAADVATAATLPGGAVLDGRPGPERIFAVCSKAPLAYPEVERAARAAAAGGDAAVRSTSALAGLPRDATQATLLVEKRP